MARGARPSDADPPGLADPAGAATFLPRARRRTLRRVAALGGRSGHRRRADPYGGRDRHRRDGSVPSHRRRPARRHRHAGRVVAGVLRRGHLRARQGRHRPPHPPPRGGRPPPHPPKGPPPPPPPAPPAATPTPPPT